MKQNIKLQAFMRRFILAWFFSVTVEYAILPVEYRKLISLEAMSQMSLGRMGVNLFVTYLVIYLVGCIVNKNIDIKKLERLERWAIFVTFMMLTACSLSESFSWTFFGACVLLGSILGAYAKLGWNFDDRKKKTKKHIRKKEKQRIFVCLTILFSLSFFLFVSIWTVCRVYSFSTPTYDMGIFSQMFYYMKTTGIPNTTMERDGLLSHFSVHVSPIYYILLPFYCMAPTPAILQVLQAMVIASAVIPLWKIGKLHGMSPLQQMCLCVVLFLYPAFSGSTAYDIHENCFLTPLILWLFYGIDRKNTFLTVIFAILTAFVKEDAPVFVAVIALWLLVKSLLYGEKWGIKVGGVMLLCSVGYFFLATTYLAKFGDGVMTNRYKNFLSNGSTSLIDVVKVIVLFPMKVVYECVDNEKMQYIALTMLPLLGIPLFTRRFERYILLIPYILINLMPDYVYQHDIFFQYSFGATACLLYITILNLEDFQKKWKPIAINGCLVVMIMVSTACFCSKVVPKATTYIKKCINGYEKYEEMREVLDQIPEDASVTAYGFYTTYLSQREVIYDLGYASKEHLLSTEYVVLKPTVTSSFKKYATDEEDGYENLVELLEENGYVLWEEIEGEFEIYRILLFAMQ